MDASLFVSCVTASFQPQVADCDGKIIRLIIELLNVSYPDLNWAGEGVYKRSPKKVALHDNAIRLLSLIIYAVSRVPMQVQWPIRPKISNFFSLTAIMAVTRFTLPRLTCFID